MSFLNKKKKKNKNKLNPIKEYEEINIENNNYNNEATTPISLSTSFTREIDDNTSNFKIKNWSIYSNYLIDEGFSNVGILDIVNGNIENGINFKISYQEHQELLSILLKGNNLISISSNNKRFFIVANDDTIIAGRDSTNHSFILRRTNNKIIIGIFDMNKLTIDKAHISMNEVYNQIISIDKSESYLNQNWF